LLSTADDSKSEDDIFGYDSEEKPKKEEEVKNEKAKFYDRYKICLKKRTPDLRKTWCSQNFRSNLILKKKCNVIFDIKIRQIIAAFVVRKMFQLCNNWTCTIAKKVANQFLFPPVPELLQHPGLTFALCPQFQIAIYTVTVKIILVILYQGKTAK
jgi:hypothetical protein